MKKTKQSKRAQIRDDFARLLAYTLKFERAHFESFLLRRVVNTPDAEPLPGVDSAEFERRRSLYLAAPIQSSLEQEHLTWLAERTSNHVYASALRLSRRANAALAASMR